MKLKEWNRVIGVGMCFLIFLLLTTLPSVIHAGIPQKINYQGYLTDAKGVPVNGTVAMVFSIYDVLKEGTPLWTETQSVQVVAGVYNVLLGAKSPFVQIPNVKLTFDKPYYLGVKVGEDAEMVPRMALTSVGYAFRAQWADNVDASTHNHDASYLNATGDSMSAASSGSVLSVTNTGTGYGVSGSGSGRGVNGTAWGDTGSGVYGYANGTSGSGVYGYGAGSEGHGVHGFTYGTHGRVIYGEAANAGDWENYGGYFLANGTYGRGAYGSASGTSGMGVFGKATNTGDVTNYGGYFQAWGTTGYGVYGHAKGAEGRGVYGNADNAEGLTNYGGYFKAAGSYGRGAYGKASGPYGIGVFGEADSTGDTTNYGGYFKAAGSTGWGVYGHATGAGGRGVRGYAENAGDGTNYGGYFTAHGKSGNGVYGYASGSEGTGVYGVATNAGDFAATYGGKFESYSPLGIGVYGHGYWAVMGEADAGYGGYFSAKGAEGVGAVGRGESTGVAGDAWGAEGQAVRGMATGTSGVGVSGVATNYSDVKNYGGYFEASGYRGIGVYGAATSYVKGAGAGDRSAGGWFQCRSQDCIGARGYSEGIASKGVHGEAHGEIAAGVDGYARGNLSVGVSGSGTYADFYAYGPGTDYAAFTGSHEVKLSGDFPGDTKPGLIVAVTGETQLRRLENGTPDLSSTLPTVKLSTKAADKAVLGVLVIENSSLPKEHWYEAKEGERFALVNALGEGRAWVSNINGDIEVGDYITTSSIPGYGQRQDDDLLHSYTLGKAIEAVDWPSVTETVLFNGREIKVYLMAVTYTSG